MQKGLHFKLRLLRALECQRSPLGGSSRRSPCLLRSEPTVGVAFAPVPRGTVVNVNVGAGEGIRGSPCDESRQRGAVPDRERTARCLSSALPHVLSALSPQSGEALLRDGGERRNHGVTNYRPGIKRPRALACPFGRFGRATVLHLHQQARPFFRAASVR